MNSRLCQYCFEFKTGFGGWICYTSGFQGGAVIKNPPINEGDAGSIPA